MKFVNNLRGGYCYESYTTRHNTRGKTTRLNWATKFLTVANDDAYTPNVSAKMARISFSFLPCRKKKYIPMLLKWRETPEMLLSASVTRKNLQYGTRTDHSFQRQYQFRPSTSGSKLGWSLISTPSYHDMGSIMWYMFQMMADWSAGWSDVKTALRRLRKLLTCIIR